MPTNIYEEKNIELLIDRCKKANEEINALRKALKDTREINFELCEQIERHKSETSESRKDIFAITRNIGAPFEEIVKKNDNLSKLLRTSEAKVLELTGENRRLTNQIIEVAFNKE